MIPKLILFSFLSLFFLVKEFETQFRQSSYNIEHERLEITHYNKSAVVDPILTLFKYNSTLKMKAINGSATFTPGVKKNILINFSLFKLINNVYRPFPINITIDLCEEWTKNTFGMQAAIKNSNFKGCPCPVGLYYMYNFVLEQDKFPPHIPSGKYKLTINVRIDDRTFLGRGVWYGSITPKTDSW